MFHLYSLAITIILILGACAPTCSDNLPETAFKATILSVTPNKLIALTDGQRIQIQITDSTVMSGELINLIDKDIWVSGVILDERHIQAHELRLVNALN